MKISVFTYKEDIERIERFFSELLEENSIFHSWTFYDNYDDFIFGFQNDNSHAALIARRGADGMESVRAARLLKPSTSLIWLSDDNGFGTESFRIGCQYFSAEPITKKLLSNALSRCTN